jgi:hypothetical protein
MYCTYMYSSKIRIGIKKKSDRDRDLHQDDAVSATLVVKVLWHNVHVELPTVLQTLPKNC